MSDPAPLADHVNFDVCAVCHPDRRGEHGEHCCCPPREAAPPPGRVEWRERLRAESLEVAARQAKAPR